MGTDRSSTARPRLVDVAKEAGVSPKTVSNLINNYPHITPATAERVRAAIDKLNYIPNGTARTLRTGRMGIIGLALPDLTMAYFAEMAALITSVAEERGYTLVIEQTDGREEREHRVVKGLRPHAIDGLIFSPLALAAEDVASVSDGKPLVLLGERDRPEQAAYVGVDNVAAARDATRHLLEIGRTRIGVIGPVPHRPHGTASLRMEGYRQALHEAGLEPVEALAGSVRNFAREVGMAAVKEVLDRGTKPDALFCFNDLMAVGALSVLHERGIRVPDDIALVGWDDIEEARYTWPPLTSVRPDKRQIAETAVDLLLRQLNGEEVVAEMYVDYRLEVRASTGG